MGENRFDFKYRIDLDAREFEILKKYLNKLDANKIIEYDLPTFNVMKQKIDKPKKIKHSWRKVFATEKATKARTAKVKEKINNAVAMLRMENKEVTPYQVSKASGVSFVTVKKYLKV